MIINDLDFVGMASAPDKANAPPIVDADAVLLPPIPFQALKAVPRQGRERSEIHSGIKNIQLAKRRALDGLEPSHSFPAKETLGIRAAEGTNHIPKLYCCPLNVKQYG
jgi:hypothetical protein